jgi:hypothetical protein
MWHLVLESHVRVLRRLGQGGLEGLPGRCQSQQASRWKLDSLIATALTVLARPKSVSENLPRKSLMEPESVPTEYFGA